MKRRLRGRPFHLSPFSSTSAIRHDLRHSYWLPTDLKDQLNNASVPSEPLPKPFETVKPSLNFFQFQGSVPEDYDSDTTIEELAESVEHVSLSEVSQALQKVHLG